MLPQTKGEESQREKAETSNKRRCPIDIPTELTVNNNAQQRMQLLPAKQRRPNGQGGCLPASAACRQRSVNISTTFADYVKFHEMVQSRSNSTAMPYSRSSDCLDGKRQSIYNRPQLSTFAEYQKLSIAQTGTRTKNPSQASTSQAMSVNEQRSTFGFAAQADTIGADESEAAAVAADFAVVDDDEGEDAFSAGTRRQGGCCACCSRGQKGQPDNSSRRKRRLVGQEGATTGVPNRVVSISLDDDAELADVKDMDPTITLMPYVLFESERIKVLYGAISTEEAELLKRAINLHANDLYKKVLMRLHLYRYLRMFKESVVRQIMSRKVILGQNGGLAASTLGIDVSDESKSSGGGGRSSTSAHLSFDSQPTELTVAVRTSTVAEVTRGMFKQAPRCTDKEILELLSNGNVIDVTGRASLESLVSLPTTKIGQRRSA